MTIASVLTGARAWQVEQGDCIDVLRALPEASVDACVTDPPYGIGFMGREWDSFDPARARARAQSLKRKGTKRTSERWGDEVGEGTQGGGVPIAYDDKSASGNARFERWCEEWATEVLRALKPGGHLVVFGGTRTYHRMVCGVEDAGFEIRDQLAWLFGSGFPKSRNLGEGRGTALKPAHEPIVMARKPLRGTVAANVQAHGTGALNIDASRLGDTVETWPSSRGYSRHDPGSPIKVTQQTGAPPEGRWPPNVALDEEAAAMLDEQAGERTSGKRELHHADGGKASGIFGAMAGAPGRESYGDTGGASRFMYVAKPDRAERSVGLDRPNTHPTVKPVALMQWLVRLVTPVGGVVLDPFTGSGTTGMAALREDRRFIGIEREAEYVAIARARIIGDAPLFNGAHANRPDSSLLMDDCNHEP